MLKVTGKFIYDSPNNEDSEAEDEYLLVGIFYKGSELYVLGITHDGFIEEFPRTDVYILEIDGLRLDKVFDKDNKLHLPVIYPTINEQQGIGESKDYTYGVVKF